MDRPHIAQASHQHHKAGPEMESPREKKEGKAKKLMATRPWGWHEKDGQNLGTIGETGPGQSRLEEPCWRPMPQEGQIGESK